MVTFVATAFEEKYESMAFIGSMLAQKDPRWKAIIYGNKYSEEIYNICQLINDNRITYKVAESNTGFWGCYNRKDAVYNMVDTDYVVQTSIQDYYLPNAVSEILSKSGASFIFWDALHHYFDWARLDTQTVIGKIDWGCFAAKTSLAKEVDFRMPETEFADGIFAVDCIQSNHFISAEKIGKVLTIHN